MVGQEVSGKMVGLAANRSTLFDLDKTPIKVWELKRALDLYDNKKVALNYANYD